jgi:hypothetical protein
MVEPRGDSSSPRRRSRIHLPWGGLRPWRRNKTLENGNPVAVKVHSDSSSQGVKEFLAEVKKKSV